MFTSKREACRMGNSDDTPSMEAPSRENVFLDHTDVEQIELQNVFQVIRVFKQRQQKNANQWKENSSNRPSSARVDINQQGKHAYEPILFIYSCKFTRHR